MNTASRAVRLYIAEEQLLLREAYQTFLLAFPSVEVVGTSSATDGASLIHAAAALHPDVILVGTKALTAATIEQLSMLRRETPTTGLLLVSFTYDVKGIGALREFSRRAPAGCAYLLKHTVSTIEQLVQVIRSVAEGRVILDPGVMEELVTVTEPRAGMLRQLSPREIEVLGWMARSYRNKAIAGILHLEPKTVERHINNIYGKLGACPDSKHPRVQAVATFLMAAGYRMQRTDQDDEDEASGGYPGSIKEATFQPVTAKSRAMDGNRSLAGTSQAIRTGMPTLTKTSPSGRS